MSTPSLESPAASSACDPAKVNDRIQCRGRDSIEYVDVSEAMLSFFGNRTAARRESRQSSMDEVRETRLLNPIWWTPI